MAPQLQNQKKTAVPNPPANTMDLLHERLVQIAEQARVLENTADAEKRSMTDGEVAELKRLREEFKGVEAEIEARESNAEMEAKLKAPVRRATPPADLEDSAGADDEQPRQRITGGDRVGVTKGSWGFRSLGEWALAARKTHNGRVDPRIMNAPATYGSEGVGPDGGFAVPPDFRQAITKSVMGEDSLLARTDQQTTSSNGISLPLDHVSPWDTSNGVQMNWVGEGAAIAASKPKLGQLEVKAHKAAALVPVTEELLADVPAMTNWLLSKVPEKFTSGLNNAIVNGDGVAKPQGLLNAACKVTVDAVSGQGANTIVAKNIQAMWARLYGPLRRNAVWLMNQDCEPQLQSMIFPGSSAAFPAYLPPGGLSATPYATLLGRPLIEVEACQALGTEGDLILCNLDEYLSVVKSGGVKTDVSIHLYFDSGHTAFRFEMRVGGQSKWPSAIARQNGSATLSPIITLNSSRT